MNTALDVRDVAVTLAGRTVLDSVDLAIDGGVVHALVGLNGAGKTTLLRVILGMLRPEAGTVRIFGADPAADRQVWRHVGHLVEAPACYPELSARENITAASALHGADLNAAGVRAEHLADELGLGPWLDTRVGRLSLGTRQKVGLVSALAHAPRLVVLDEPTNGLDPLAVVALREMLHELTADGAAVLVTSHHFDEVARVAGRVDVLHHGRIVDTLTPGGTDLEHAFFHSILTADRAAQEQP